MSRFADVASGSSRPFGILCLALWLCAVPLHAQPGAPVQTPAAPAAQGSSLPASQSAEAPPDRLAQLEQLKHAMQRLPVAAGLAVLLALRPRRRGTPPRQAQVVQTQIILAVVGAVVMLVVGASLARAFGIVGAAGLVRYRAKIDDPKDAGVMLSTLAVGLASGVGLWMLALLFSRLRARGAVGGRVVRTGGAAEVHVDGEHDRRGVQRPRVERLLARSRLQFELRALTSENIIYEVRVPLDAKTRSSVEGYLALDPENATGVEWGRRRRSKAAWATR